MMSIVHRILLSQSFNPCYSSPCLPSPKPRPSLHPRIINRLNQLESILAKVYQNKQLQPPLESILTKNPGGRVLRLTKYLSARKVASPHDRANWLSDVRTSLEK